jgi:voltage-gated potassium channel
MAARPRLHPRRLEHAPPPAPWRQAIFRVIFGVDTRAGRAFDVALIVAIVLSVLVVVLDSVAEIRAEHHALLAGLEWFFTLVFTVEYAARLVSVRSPHRYALSFLGLVDLLAVLPTYLALFVPGAHNLLAIRMLRMLRIFRVFKLTGYLWEADILVHALRASRRKIIVFLTFVLSLAVIMGSLMYLIEGEASGFTSIPRGMYWAIVTMTTVGYGDIAPRSVPGQTLAAGLMILGYAVIAVPTGIVTAELTRAQLPRADTGRACPECGADQHDGDAAFCKHCGSELAEPQGPPGETGA